MRKLAAILSVFLLSACSVVPSQPAPPQRHDFGLWSAEGGRVSVPVTLASVTAPAWLDGTAIVYRDTETAPTALHQYANNEWVAPPADLLRAALERRLAEAGSTGGPSYRLRLHLMAFEQRIEGSNARVRMTLEAVLLPPSRAPASASQHRIFALERPVTPDVDGAITGLAGIAREGVARVMNWLDKQTGHSRTDQEKAE